MLAHSGAIKLFQASGVTVFLHWSWLLVAVFEISQRSGTYSSFTWNVLEYLALFGIVTMHEFGHAFACRSVGGRADEILLWPLGGVAIVDPPPLPGATLWSIAAGPLVNVALAPILGGLALLIPAAAAPDVDGFCRSLAFINVGLLLFNLLPIYPLDGGQILGALLWFVVGRARSMIITAVIGLVGVVGVAWLALSTASLWLVLIALLVASQCWRSIQHARLLNSMAGGTRRTGEVCPSCHEAAPIGPHWRCDRCGTGFDVFDLTPGATPEPSEITTLALSGRTVATAASAPDGMHCPVCHADAATVRCPRCHAIAHIADWNSSAVATGLHDVTRPRPPRIPSVAPIVLGVCAGIVALMVIFLAIVTYTASSREVDAGATLFMRQVALIVFGLSGVPAVASILFFVRYGRVRRAFNHALQQFQDEHRAGSIT